MTNDDPLFFSRRRERDRRSRNRARMAVILAVLIAAAAGAWWLWLRPSGEGGTGPATLPADTGLAAETPARDRLADTLTVDLPPIAESDAFVRERLAELSSHPRLSSWLDAGELVQRFVTAVVNLANGDSPREPLDFLEPEGDFQVEEGEGRTVIDPASYRRYDAYTDAVLSVDAEAAGRVYRLLHPLFEQLHRQLGFSDRSFDEALSEAIGPLLEVEVPDGAPAVTASVDVYEYVDPELEALSPAQKHLLRLGPANARRVQEKLAELAEAMGVVVSDPVGGG